MSTKALSNIVPGGSAASSALGYRLMTLSGVTGPDAGFALATAGLGSAVVLNLHLLDRAAGVDPVPRRQPAVRHGRAGRPRDHARRRRCIVVGLQHGQGRAEKFLRWLGAQAALRRRHRHQRPAPDRPAAGGADRRPRAAQAGGRCGRASTGCSTRRRCGCSCGRSAGPSTSTPCSIAFGLANIFAVIPITPGGLGIVEGVYIPTLIGFGLTRQEATLGVASYRLAQFWFPILLGGVLYASAARRAVVDRPTRPPRPAARHRPAGDRRERAADRVRDAPVGAQAARRAAPDRRGGPHRAALRRRPGRSSPPSTRCRTAVYERDRPRRADDDEACSPDAAEAKGSARRRDQ